MIKKSTLTFLKQLAKNNDRDWFQDNKARYEAAREDVAEYAQDVLDGLAQSDVIATQNGKKSMMRIYRDVRFSKDKRPYKVNFAGGFKRDGKLRRGGYHYHIVPEGAVGSWSSRTVVGGGFYSPERDDLKRIREELAADASELRQIIADDEFTRLFGELRGDQLKTAPKGFVRDHENIDLLRYKNFYVFRPFTDAQVLSDDFVDMSVEAYLGIRPFFDYFSEVLTTDGNGEVVV